MDFFYLDIYNDKGQPVPFTSIVSNSQTNEVLSTFNSDGINPQVKIYTADWPLSLFKVTIKATGFKTVVVTLDKITDTTIFLQKKSSLAILELIAAAGIIAFARKKKKKVGSLTMDEVRPFLYIGGGLLAFDSVKRILEGLGIWKSTATKGLDDTSTNPNSFWNPNFWRTVKPDGANWTYAIDVTTAQQWLSDLRNAFGAFNDDEETAIGVFKRCRTQANCSFLADIFNRTYNQDLLSWLRGGFWPQDRLSDADVYTINNYISRLPKY